MKTLRLNFPQWQGAGDGTVAHLVPEVDFRYAQTGYYLGSQLLNWLLPSNTPTAEVPVSLDTYDLTEQNGIYAYQANKKQLASALTILQQFQPEKVLTLGGDCAVSIAPFSYLTQRYGADELAVIWIDAHPDLGLPYDEYTGFHAMALAQIAGFGDPEITQTLPAFIHTENSLFVGLRYFGEPAEQRRKNWQMEMVSCKQANQSSAEVLTWLKKQGKRKVLIHLDLDVLDPNELKFAVGTDPDGMTLKAVSRVINDIAQNAEIVGLTIAEPMPREVLKLKSLLDSLPLFNR